MLACSDMNVQSKDLHSTGIRHSKKRKRGTVNLCHFPIHGITNRKLQVSTNRPEQPLWFLHLLQRHHPNCYHQTTRMRNPLCLLHFVAYQHICRVSRQSIHTCVHQWVTLDCDVFQFSVKAMFFTAVSTKESRTSVIRKETKNCQFGAKLVEESFTGYRRQRGTRRWRVIGAYRKLGNGATS